MRTMLLVLMSMVAAGIGHAKDSDWRMAEAGDFLDVEVTPDGQTVVLRAENKALRSTDGGKTFAEIFAGDGEVAGIATDRQGRVWATRGAKLGRLDAGGETWLPIAFASRVTSIAVDGDVIVLAGTEADEHDLGMYKAFVSKDGGKTFTARRWELGVGIDLKQRDGIASYVTVPEDEYDVSYFCRGSVDLDKLPCVIVERAGATADGAMVVSSCGKPGQYVVCAMGGDATVALEGAKGVKAGTRVRVAQAGARRFLKVGSRFYEAVGTKLTLIAERNIDTFYGFAFAAGDSGTLWVLDTGLLFRVDNKRWTRVTPSAK